MTSPTIDLTSSGGVALAVRPAVPEDAFALDRFFDRLSPEDLRFRFLSTAAHVGYRLIEEMTAGDPDESETFLACDPADGAVLAVTMLAFVPQRKAVEVAISVRSDLKGRGIGWELLRFAERRAAERGAAVIEAIESRDNRQAIGVEDEQGYRVEAMAGDPGLVRLVKSILPDD